MPYAFLDDAPLEERRTQAVISRRRLDTRTVDTLGALDPDAVRRVREEAWPDPENAEEVHEALTWMGYVTEDEAAASGWTEWLAELAQTGRVVAGVTGGGDALVRGRGDARTQASSCAAGSTRSARSWWVATRAASRRGPGHGRAPALLELEAEGSVMRCRIGGRNAWCERRLLARIHRLHPRSPASRDRAGHRRRVVAIPRLLAARRRAFPPRGSARRVRGGAQARRLRDRGREWEASIFASRVRGYRPEWLDHLTLTGELAWGRLWGRGDSRRSGPRRSASCPARISIAGSRSRP